MTNRTRLTLAGILATVILFKLGWLGLATAFVIGVALGGWIAAVRDTERRAEAYGEGFNAGAANPDPKETR